MSRFKVKITWKHLMIALAAIIGVAVLWYLIHTYELSLKDIRQYVESAPAWIFLGALLLLPPLGFPLSLFLVVTGARFGVGIGSVAALIAIVAHHFIAFGLARIFSSGKRASTKSASLWKRLDEKANGNSAKLLFLWGLIPGPPYSVKLYLPLAMGASRLQFVKWCTLGHLIGTVVFVGMGEAILQGESGLIITLVIIAFVLSLGLGLFRKRLLGVEKKGSTPPAATTTTTR